MSRHPSGVASFLLPIFALFAASGWWVFNGSALLSLHKRWWTVGEIYEIGYPLVAIGVYWIATQRQRLRYDAIAPSLIGCALFVLALLVSCAARLAQLQVVQQLMVPVSLWFGLLAVLGWRVAMPLLLPCLLLVCGVPAWDFLSDPLRLAAVHVSHFLLNLVRIPSLVDGYDIVLPDGIIQVAEACSGLNLLLAALVLGVLQAALSLRSNWRRLLVVAIAVAIGVVDNWIRVFVLIVIAHYSEMRSSLVSDHIGFGWTLFAVSLIPFFLIARAIERGEKSAEVAHARVAEVAATVPKVGAAAVAAAFVALAAVGLSTYAGHLERSTTSAVKAFAPPPGALATTSGWLPEYTGYDLAQTWRLASAQRVYDLAVLLYSEQRQGKKLIYYSNRIADSALVRYTTKIALASGQNVNLTVLGGKEPRAVWWYYRIDGTATTSTWRAKMLQLRATLKGDSSAALVVISVRCRDRDCAADVVAESGGALLQNLDASLQALPAEHRG